MSLVNLPILKINFNIYEIGTMHIKKQYIGKLPRGKENEVLIKKR